MSKEDERLGRFRAALNEIPLPKQLPTEAELIDGEMQRFRGLWQTVGRLNEVVQERFGKVAGIAIDELKPSRESHAISAAIVARLAGTKPSQAPAKRFPFKIQGGQIWVGGKHGSFPGGIPTENGALYRSEELDLLLDNLVNVLTDYYRHRS